MRRFDFRVAFSAFGAALVAILIEAGAIAQSDRSVAPVASVSVGPWSYEFTLKAWGTRSEGEWGFLTFDGKELDERSVPDLRVNDYLHAPWGTMYWRGVSKFPWGPHGWFPLPLNDKKGKRVVAPNAPIDECLLAEADDGTEVRVAPKTRIVVRLPAAKTFDRTWELKVDPPGAIEATSQPTSRRAPLPPGWGSAARMQYSLSAARPGAATLTFTHGKPSPKTIRIAVVVAE